MKQIRIPDAHQHEKRDGKTAVFLSLQVINVSSSKRGFGL
jgi:hypothetical protein